MFTGERRRHSQYFRSHEAGDRKNLGSRKPSAGLQSR